MASGRTSYYSSYTVWGISCGGLTTVTAASDAQLEPSQEGTDR